MLKKHLFFLLLMTFLLKKRFTGLYLYLPHINDNKHVKRLGRVKNKVLETVSLFFPFAEFLYPYLFSLQQRTFEEDIVEDTGQTQSGLLELALEEILIPTSTLFVASA